MKKLEGMLMHMLACYFYLAGGIKFLMELMTLIFAS